MGSMARSGKEDDDCAGDDSEREDGDICLPGVSVPLGLVEEVGSDASDEERRAALVRCMEHSGPALVVIKVAYTGPADTGHN